MSLKRGSTAFFLYALIWSTFGASTVTLGAENDVLCLKSIKDSLVDPHNYLKSWDFSYNNTDGFVCTFVGVECWNGIDSRVMNIRLPDMELKGQFPDGIESCATLTGLDLSGNQLHGPIPSDIGKRLPYITSLDLSFNNFSGEIPSSIADCRYLSFLKLDHNQLVGQIPPQLALLGRLKILNVSSNLLSGPVPNFVNGTVSSDSFASNEGLCGEPLISCSINDEKNAHKKFKDSFKSGFVIGYVLWATSTIVVFASYCIPWMYIEKRHKKITVAEMIAWMIPKKQKRAEEGQVCGNPTAELLERETKEIPSIFDQVYRGEGRRISFHLISVLEKVVTRMSFIDLSNATENFTQSNIIGLGLMGTMYKATLPNGWFLAVKRMHDSRQFEEHMVSELKTLGRLRHNNLVPLLGFCIESKERLLVYKYISNGNLFDWLHPVEAQKKILEWPLRVKIAVGVARGLAWLHHSCNARVVHLNISSRCILLDRNFEPKLSNFGEAMLMVSTETSRVSSDFWEMAFVKEDVHGYGVLLLELITGVNTSRMTDISNSILNEWISHLLSSSNFYNVIDKSLIGQGFDAEIFQVLKVACNCVDTIPDQRPTMLQVYKDIRAIRERCGLVDDSDFRDAITA